jgi:dipeptidyl aminopeptidase/acylaminoacyl peptidase
MERDLRETPLYREVEAFYRSALEPGFGSVSAARDPRPSPDGGVVAFVGERLDRLEGAPQGRICLARADGSGFRQVTNGPGDDVDPRWSPDGARLSFLSDRGHEGRMQPFVLEAGELGEARALPEVPGSVEYHAWSPDGLRLLLGVAGLGADRAGAAGSGTAAAGSELPGWMPEVESPDNVEREWRRLYLLDVATEQLSRLSAEGVNVWEAAWCGDDAVVAIVSDDPGEHAWYAAPLVRIEVPGGAQRELVRSDVQLGWATGSPDGRHVAVIEALSSDRLVLAGDVVVVDAATGDARRIDTDGVDVGRVVWRDDRRALAIGQRGLDSVAGEIDLAGGWRETWRSPEASGTFEPDAAPLGRGDGLVVAVHSHRRPPTIVAVRDGAERVLADPAHEGAAVIRGALARRDPLRWRASDGLEIEGLLTVPAEGAAPYPLIVWVHGGPVWAHQDRWPRGLVALLASRGYAVLEPNPRGSYGRGRKFAEMVVGDMGGADARDILSGVDALVEQGLADPERIGVTGGSYGGFMSCWLPAIDQRFRASVAISPVTDWYSQHFNSNIGHRDADFLRDRPERPGGEYHARSPVLAADRVRTPTLLTAGLRDRCTPPGQAIEFYRALRSLGVPTEVVVYPNEGHGVRNLPAAIDAAARAVAWFERYMPARP